jgi:hypothetical protein
MRQHINLALVAMLTFGLLGCATFETNAGKTLVTITSTVDKAMQGWAVWVSLGKATPQQQATVKSAYEKYQIAELAAEHAYASLVANKDKTAWTQAAALLTATQSDILAIITAITGK